MTTQATPGALGSNDDLGRLPTVARLYYTGQGSRRYKRASVQNGPGEPLTFVSLAEYRVRQAVALERQRWATAARLCVDATPEQLPLALDALRDVLRA